MHVCVVCVARTYKAKPAAAVYTVMQTQTRIPVDQVGIPELVHLGMGLVPHRGLHMPHG